MNGLPSRRLNHRKLKRAAIIAAGLLTIVVLSGVFLCRWLGIHSRRDVLAYRTMEREHYHPVWKDLALQRIKKGDRLEDLLQRRPPLHRDDFGPYTDLYYMQPDSFNALGIVAKDGKLIAADAGGGTWHHTFFVTVEEQEAHAQWRLLEREAFRIHRAVKAGQDVFFARLVETPGELPLSQDTVEQLRVIYGQDYLDAMTPGGREMTIDVTNVLHGGLQVGTVLTVAASNCGLAGRGEPEPVFLHFEDRRLIFPQYPAGESHMTIPRRALDWYQSLTPDQVKDLEARRMTEWAERARLTEIEGTAGEGP